MTADYFSSFANHLWQSTVFAGVAALMALLLRKNRASIRYWLWIAASVKFLIPFSLLVAVGGRFEWRRPASVVTQPQVISAMESVSRPFAPVDVAPSAVSNTVPLALFAVWLAGVAVVVVWSGREWRRVRRALKAATSLDLSPSIQTMSTPAPVEPGVVGILRPVLLLPEGITSRLSKVQLESILIHELCHVRRRDNLAAAIHMVVETVFWFHPLVWWIERRLVEERERACDEEVLRVIGEPEDYAQGILNVCKLYTESSPLCVSGVAGSDLKKRIEEIMAKRIIQTLGVGRTLLLVVVALVAVAAPIAFGTVRGAQEEAKIEAAPKPERPTNLLDDAASSDVRANAVSYLEEIEKAGFTGLTVDQAISLKVHGVDGAYIAEVRAMGFEPNADELVSLKVHGITPAFVREARSRFKETLTMDQLVSLKVHGILN